MKVYQAFYPVTKPNLKNKFELIEAENKWEAVKKIRDSEPYLTNISDIDLRMVIPSFDFDKYYRTKDEFGLTVYYLKEESK